jgi:mannose-binding lectin 2
LQIEAEFKIEGTGSLYGDGMAIWLTKQRAQQGPVFGFTDKFEGLGIFIDTYKNDRPGVVFPYVMAMMGDGNTAYDKAHDGKANELAGCPVRILPPAKTGLTRQAHNVRNGQNASRIKLRYFHDKSLDVSLAYDAEHKNWEKCFSLPGVKLPSVAYLGFSAETGELSDNHDLVSVETRNLYELNQNTIHAGSAGAHSGAAEKGGRRKKGLKEGGSRHGWTWVLIKFLMLGFLVAGVYIGFTAYRSQKSRSRF